MDARTADANRNRICMMQQSTLCIDRNVFQYYNGNRAACRGILNVRNCCAGYIGEFEFVDDHRGGKIVVELNGRWVT